MHLNDSDAELKQKSIWSDFQGQINWVACKNIP